MNPRHKQSLFNYLKSCDPTIKEVLSFNLKQTNDLDGLAFEHITFSCKVIDKEGNETLKNGLARRHDFLAWCNTESKTKIIWVTDEV